MDPEYDLNRLGYPGELDRFCELIEGVARTGDPLIVTQQGRAVAVVIYPDDLALLRRLAEAASTAQSDERDRPPA